MSIMVYNTSKFSLESLADSLCAASANSQVEARHNLSSQLAGINYVYEWINATSANADSIAIPSYDKAKVCSKELLNVEVGLNVKIKDIGCDKDITKIIPIKNPVGPSIDCSFSKDTIIYNLLPTQKDTTIDLFIPTYSADCDSNPSLKLEVVFSNSQKHIISVVNAENLFLFPLGITIIQ